MGKPKPSAAKYHLKLFVSGASPNSSRAITNLQKLLESHAAGDYTLNIVDVRKQASLAQDEQIIALPLLIKKAPLPERRFIGDMSDTKKVLAGLGIALNPNV